MSTSVANVQATNMELTPMRVKVTRLGVTTDLGGTLDNVVVSLETGKAEIKADQYGDTPLDRRISGQTYKITTKITEIKDKDKFKLIFPSLKKVTSLLGAKALYSESVIGQSDLDQAVQLLLHPLSLSDADLSGDWLFYKATPVEVTEITYGPTEQAALQVEWAVYPDTSVSPARFFIQGDPSIGLIAASAGAPVAASGNAGDGTVGSVVVNNEFTNTETITLLCVGEVTNAGYFQVSGSVSGQLGVAEVGMSFVSDPISLTISDGSADFDIGDSFTIATTASNYS